ncbi:MAG: TPM domain-containing protein [Bacteroidota bacterium]|nr:TPM domain-containing protein [Bacteroidota bacterium]
MRPLPVHIAVAATLLLAVGHAHAEFRIPRLQKYVTDLAGVLSPSFAEELDRRLAEYDRSTSNQFVVLVLPSLEGESIEDVALRTAELNGIGRKGRDNGLLFLIAAQDRKMRIEVGYGLEGVVTDALTSSIIRNVAAPKFREGDFDGGIGAAMEALMQAARGEYRPVEEKPAVKERGGRTIVFVFFVLFILLSIMRRKRGGVFWFIWPFGGFSGGGFSGGGFTGGGFSGGFSGGGGGFGGGGSSGSW